MNQKKTVWINLDETKVDITCLDKHFAEKGYIFIKKEIPLNDEQATIEMGNQADAIISTNEPWNARTLEAIAGKHKYIVRYGAGTDNIDVSAATKLGIPVANVPGANSAAVAEVALMHILNVGRRFTQCVDGCKKGIWPSTITGNELDGKVLGLVGFGNIAKQLARMVSGFNVKIIAFDTYLNEDGAKIAEKLGIELGKSIEYIFQNSDIVSLHIPLNDNTKGIVNDKLFNIMKPTSYLVNTCRGGIINEDDLVDALYDHKLCGAGLDVLCDEPPKNNNPLLDMKNVFVTSHMGAASFESEYRSQVIMADSIDTFFSGKLPYNIKNKEVIAK